MNTLGAVPVDMTIAEVYIALDRGILDAYVQDWDGLKAWKLHEVTKYRTATPRGMWMDLLAVTMNWDKWNSLPPEVQKIFDELSGASMAKIAGEPVNSSY